MSDICPFPQKVNGEQDGRTAWPKSVCVVGLGYIGLPTAAILAQRGFQVHGVDIRPDVVETINRGEIHIHEPGLRELVSDAVSSGKLSATCKPVEADVYFICVPTPIRENKSPDLSFVEAAADAIRPFVRPGNTIILESTSPPRTTQDIVVRRAVPDGLDIGRDVFVAYCPERVIPGRILIEAIENDRIVGGITAECTSRVKQFYESFVTGGVLPTNAVTAEITKLIENAYRDVNIAFANELSMLAEQLEADPYEVIDLANRHPRVNILTPGPGVGGHCISVDPWFLVHAAEARTPLIRTAREVNDAKPHFVVQQIHELTCQLDSPVIGCLGLTYKPDVDDVRESPSIPIIRQLQHVHPNRVLVCDPYVTPDQFPDMTMAPLDEIIHQSDALVLLTDHQVFAEIPRDSLGDKPYIDTRGAWTRQSCPVYRKRSPATPDAQKRAA